MRKKKPKCGDIFNVAIGTRKMEISVPMEFGEGRFGTQLYINGQMYHFERLLKKDFVREYRVDNDADFDPQADAEGYCYLIAPTFVWGKE